MVRALTALCLGIAATTGGTLAQAVAPQGDLAPFISAGGGITAVAALAFIARYMAQGRLVPRDIVANEQALTAIAKDNQRLAEESIDREKVFVGLLTNPKGGGGGS